jgi:hypothetical protein
MVSTSSTRATPRWWYAPFLPGSAGACAPYHEFLYPTDNFFVCQSAPGRLRLCVDVGTSSPFVMIRVRVEIMGSQKCGIVGKSQSVLIVTNPNIFTRTRIIAPSRRHCARPCVGGRSRGGAVRATRLLWRAGAADGGGRLAGRRHTSCDGEVDSARRRCGSSATPPPRRPACSVHGGSHRYAAAWALQCAPRGLPLARLRLQRRAHLRVLTVTSCDDDGGCPPPPPQRARTIIIYRLKKCLPDEKNTQVRTVGAEGALCLRLTSVDFGALPSADAITRALQADAEAATAGQAAQ